MAEFIDGAIDKLKPVVQHGKLKYLKKKVRERILKPIADEAPDISITDNISKNERKKIVRKASQLADNPVSRIKKELSDKVRKDLKLAESFLEITKNFNVSEECLKDILVKIGEYLYLQD